MSREKKTLPISARPWPTGYDPALQPSHSHQRRPPPRRVRDSDGHQGAFRKAEGRPAPACRARDRVARRRYGADRCCSPSQNQPYRCVLHRRLTRRQAMALIPRRGSCSPPPPSTRPDGSLEGSSRRSPASSRAAAISMPGARSCGRPAMLPRRTVWSQQEGIASVVR
jgi:hypothetical protein